MKRGYIRITSRSREADQRKALAAAGVKVIYVGGVKGTIDDCIRSLRPGDELWGTALDRIASNKKKLRSKLADIRARKSVIVEALKGRRSDNPDDMADMVIDALSRKGHSTRLAKKFGKMNPGGGKEAKVSEAKAKRIWRDKGIATNREAAELIGLSERTCYRRWEASGRPSGRRT